jgi:hypothetical protein
LKFFFTAHSAWCPFKKSGNLEVKLRRPEITSCEWKDGEGSATGKGLAGETLKMSVSCNEDMEDGAGVTFRVYKEGADPERDKPEYEIGSKNEGGTAEAEWTYTYKHDPEKPLTEKPKYFFTVNAQRCKEAKSGNVEISRNYVIYVRNEGGAVKNTTCTVALSDGSMEEISTDDEGKISLDERVPGVSLWIKYTDEDGNERQISTPELIEKE